MQAADLDALTTWPAAGPPLTADHTSEVQVRGYAHGPERVKNVPPPGNIHGPNEGGEESSSSDRNIPAQVHGWPPVARSHNLFVVDLRPRFHFFKARGVSRGPGAASWGLSVPQGGAP